MSFDHENDIGWSALYYHIQECKGGEEGSLDINTEQVIQRLVA
ncbi:hypothetical protein MTR67_033156 [Solanum verrucosum]|uniref:Uncharacterized protein n=1 Tax=Solanum verrucosum TaxID=315347 RepID=A0AAF0U5W0_SOLVR|nr:hypothetical protein MTR67_033156 [Solanum verrucosum]